MNFFRHVLALSATIAGFTPCSWAHHGQEFLVVQDAAVPSLWTGVAFGSLEWSRDAGDNTFSTEPGLMVGIAPRVAFGGTVGFTDEGGSWAYESVTPTLQVQLTPSAWKMRVSVVAGYHFAESSTQPVSSPPATSSQPPAPAPPATAPAPVAPPPPIDGGTVDPNPVACGPEFGPDAPPCPEPATTLSSPRRKLRHAGHSATPPPSTNPAATRPSSPKKPSASSASNATTSSTTTPDATTAEPYDGIHRHNENHAFARLVLEADLTSMDKIIFNLIGLWPEGSKPAWGYACGLRHAFSHTWAAGLEAIGDFGDANEHELILGAYCSPSHRLALKLGAGLGLTSTSPDFALRTGVVWRF